MSLAICHYIIVPYINADVISPSRVSHIDEVPFLKAEFLPLTKTFNFSLTSKSAPTPPNNMLIAFDANCIS